MEQICDGAQSPDHLLSLFLLDFRRLWWILFVCFSVWRAETRLWTCRTLRMTRLSLSSPWTSRDSGSTGPTRSVDTNNTSPHWLTLRRWSEVNIQPPELLKFPLKSPQSQLLFSHIFCICSLQCFVKNHKHVLSFKVFKPEILQLRLMYLKTMRRTCLLLEYLLNHNFSLFSSCTFLRCTCYIFRFAEIFFKKPDIHIWKLSSVGQNNHNLLLIMDHQWVNKAEFCQIDNYRFSSISRL